MSNAPVWPAVAGIVAGAALVGGSLWSASKIENPRPPRADRSTVGSKHVALRLSEREMYALKALVDDANRRAAEVGMLPYVNQSNYIKWLIVEESKRRGVGEWPPPGAENPRRVGRPPKEDRSLVSFRHLGLRVNEYEYKLLGVLLADANKRMAEAGYPPILNFTSLIKMFIVQEAKRRGLTSEQTR